MHGWPVWIVAAAAVLTALSVIWRLFLKPLGEILALLEEAVPLLKAQVVAFRGIKDPYPVLEAIIAQTRSDSGSTLRDAINRTEEIADQLKAAEQRNQERDEKARRLAAKDRRILADMAKQLDAMAKPRRAT